MDKYERWTLEELLESSGYKAVIREASKQWREHNIQEWAKEAKAQLFEGLELHYGECPTCGESCQPDFPNDDRTEEMVQCDKCSITWTLHRDDPTDKHDGTEPWRTYRISDVEAS